MVKLATWNVNSLKVRLPQVLDWFDTEKVDVLALQETKTEDKNFPVSAFEERGYYVEYIGQKAYNGVAVISRFPLEGVVKGFPTSMDEQKRVLACTFQGIRLINIYVPNGASVYSEKYQYKLDWLIQLMDFIQEEQRNHTAIAIAGDFNIAPEDKDVHDPLLWEGSVLVSPAERKAFMDILALGFCDSFRLLSSAEDMYTWWDYRTFAFKRNRGLRIDHILLSKELSHRCTKAYIDKKPREALRPSDHTPFWVNIG